MRKHTIPVKVGNVTIGGGAPIVVQTMCDTATEDVGASVAQIRRIQRAGCNLVRLTVQGERQVEAMKEIREQLPDVALIADIHFRPDVAVMVAPYVDKVRINPGNYVSGDRAEAMCDLEELLNVCREHNTAIRIGINHGSLAKRIVEQWGDTPRGMVEAAMEFLEQCRRSDFDQVVVSMKSSNVRVMVEAYRLLAREMERRDMHYPLHLGVTEAGSGQSGRIKSAVGIGTLLKEGLGDTIRVSLTEPPENEVEFAKKLANQFHSKLAISSEQLVVDNIEDLALAVSLEAGGDLLDGRAADLKVEVEGFPQAILDDIAADVLQATRVRITKTEYIACPGCGRTLYDLQHTLEEVKRRTQHLVGLRIAVMGCIVNGPGEMADADYGYVGAGVGKVSLYKGKELVKSNVPQEEAIDEMLKLIDECQ